MDGVYLDHAASTPARPEVVEAMLPWLSEHPGNPSGSHAVARAARRAIDDARDLVAALVGAQPGEVVFTSGGTEADNLAVDGVVRSTGCLPACSAVEHPAVLAPVAEAGGIVVPTDAGGRIDLGALAEVLSAVDGIGLVSVMLVNNETGVVNDLDAVTAVLVEAASDAVLHTDAVQAVAWMDLTVACRSAGLVSLTGHKFGGPKGAGVLIVRSGVDLAPVLRGGGQERERRSGTQNVPAIVGLGEAARLVVADRAATVTRVGALRERLEAGRRPGQPPHPSRGPPPYAGGGPPLLQGRRERVPAVPAGTRRRVGQCRLVVCQRGPGAVARAGRHGRRAGVGPGIPAALAGPRLR